MREIKLYNPGHFGDSHLGDNVFMMIFFYNIKEYIEEHNIIILYYCSHIHMRQIMEFQCSNNIHILDLDIQHLDNTIATNVSLANVELKLNWHSYFKQYKTSEYIVYEHFYGLFYNNLLEIMGIPQQSRIIDLNYQDEDLLTRFENLPLAYKNIDILIINSQPLSQQFNLNHDIWNPYITLLHQRYNVVTTKKVEGVKCTMDDDMTIKTIAAISTRSKVVIAINTGVLPGFFNTYSFDYVKKWFIFDKTITYHYPRFEHKNEITDISLDELERICVAEGEANTKDGGDLSENLLL